jgi:hypothetical protein
MLGSEHDMVTVISVAGMSEKLRLGGVVLQPIRNAATTSVSDVALFIVMLLPNDAAQ